MNFLLLGSVAGTLLGWLMGFLSLFLIMLILIQRGKGGGLTGALGGPGGQSAFGSKAGDTFTVITVVVASIWAFTCAFTMWLLGAHAPTTAITDSKIKAGPGDSQPADESAIPPIGGDPVSGLGQSGIGGAANRRRTRLDRVGRIDSDRIEHGRSRRQRGQAERIEGQRNRTCGSHQRRSEARVVTPLGHNDVPPLSAAEVTTSTSDLLSDPQRPQHDWPRTCVGAWRPWVGQRRSPDDQQSRLQMFAAVERFVDGTGK